METRLKNNISRQIPFKLNYSDDIEELPGLPNPPIGIAGWVTKVDKLLVYDDYDLW